MKRLVILILVFASMVAACSGGGNSTPTPQPTVIQPAATATPSISGTVTIFAATSLTDSFNEEGQAFQRQYSNAKVTFNFASSSTLRTQLTQGAKADIFASADEVNVQQAQAAGVIDGDRIPFVANQLAIVVNKSSNKVTGLHDLAKPGMKVVLVDPAAPAGTYADEALTKLAADPQYGQAFADAVRKNIVTRAANVRQATLAVETGEADAAIAYTTDALVSDKLQAVPFPDSLGIRPLYFLGIVKGASNAEGGRAFAAFLRSDAGVQILLKYGFLKP